MLVLARKINQSVMIGDDIKVTIIEVAQGKVKIGISAPHNVAVHREEVWEEIQKENLLAQQSMPDALERATESFKPPGPGFPAGAPADLPPSGTPTDLPPSGTSPCGDLPQKSSEKQT